MHFPNLFLYFHFLILICFSISTFSCFMSQSWYNSFFIY